MGRGSTDIETFLPRSLSSEGSLPHPLVSAQPYMVSLRELKNRLLGVQQKLGVGMHEVCNTQERRRRRLADKVVTESIQQETI